MTPRFSPSVLLLVALFLGALSLGCGGAEGLFTISGNVTYDGQQVDRGTIGFVQQETSANKSIGTTIVDGHYELGSQEGLSEGSYKVQIYAERPSGRKIQADEGSTEMVQPMVQYMPDIYNARTNLRVEISEDRDDLNFDLKKPKRTKKSNR